MPVTANRVGPERLSLIHRQLRRVLVRRFPYAVYFGLEATDTVIFVVLRLRFRFVGKQGVADRNLSTQWCVCSAPCLDLFASSAGQKGRARESSAF